MGPTAAGKTDAALSLVRRFPFEIVSVDSSLVYRGLEIGTAKPGPEVLARFPHHLVDIRDPHETFSAAEFNRAAGRAILDIVRRGRLPLLVGGTMFYFHALERGISPLPAANADLREDIAARAARQGWTALHRRLQQLDPARAAQIDPGDKQRIQRALEIVELTGGPLAAAPRRRGLAGISIVKIGLAPWQRSTLHARIERRFRQMLRNGFVEEVKNLLKLYDNKEDLPALKMVGYRQVVRYLRAEMGYDEMLNRGVAATRQLAKRQLTWLRNQPGVTWFEAGSAAGEKILRSYVHSKLTVLGI